MFDPQGKIGEPIGVWKAATPARPPAKRGCTV